MEIRNLRVAIHNLGCKVNDCEAEAMRYAFTKEGAVIVAFEDAEADVCIVNTCCVTNIADRKSRQMLHRARALHPGAVIVAVGCYVQEKAAELESDSAVDILIGNNEKGHIVDAVRQFTDIPAAKASAGDALSASEKNQVEYTSCDAMNDKETLVPAIREEKDFEELETGERSDQGRAFVKIQDGCDQFCSYCIIPYVRGRIRSRALPDILKEVQDLAARGCHEIVLTGIHLSSYGLDLDGRSYEEALLHGFSSERLLAVIRAAARVPGIRRIRLGSLEPRIMTEEFVKALGEIQAVCPHFHLSLQSGCDATLKRMNRHYTTEDFREAVQRIRAAFSEVAITTDVITGFPGETDEEFEQSYQFVKEIGFYEMHVFRYSRRQGTVADKLPSQVPDNVKQLRSDQLIRLSEEASDRFRRSFLCRKTTIIPEESVSIGGKKYLRGYNPSYVRFLLPVGKNGVDEGKIGQIIEAIGTEICQTCVLAMPVQMV